MESTKNNKTPETPLVGIEQIKPVRRSRPILCKNCAHFDKNSYHIWSDNGHVYNTRDCVEYRTYRRDENTGRLQVDKKYASTYYKNKNRDCKDFKLRWWKLSAYFA